MHRFGLLKVFGLYKFLDKIISYSANRDEFINNEIIQVDKIECIFLIIYCIHVFKFEKYLLNFASIIPIICIDYTLSIINTTQSYKVLYARRNLTWIFTLTYILNQLNEINNIKSNNVIFIAAAMLSFNLIYILYNIILLKYVSYLLSIYFYYYLYFKIKACKISKILLLYPIIDLLHISCHNKMLCISFTDVLVKNIFANNLINNLNSDVMNNVFLINKYAILRENIKLNILKKMLPYGFDNTVLNDTIAVKKIRRSSLYIPEIIILYLDIVNFSKINDSPTYIYDYLTNIYENYNKEIKNYNDCNVLETIGDTYIVSYVPKNNIEDKKIIDLALKFIDISNSSNINIRVGLHIGEVVGGTINTENPKFSLYGATMNFASRLESTGTINKIHISEKLFDKIKYFDDYKYEKLENTHLKNMGDFTTYLISP